MIFLLDKPETEREFQKLLKQIKMRKNGDVTASMKRQGILYKTNWGVSVVELRELARNYNKNHLLALKLWNKQWRESMILATMLDEAGKVTEEQMDFWTKSFENQEIAEQASTNLWVHTKYAFAKSLEWCRGKKHYVRSTGIHLLGRLAITQKDAIDEMFEPYFEELAVLGRDVRLHSVIYRTVMAVGVRSPLLNQMALHLAKSYLEEASENTPKLGESLLEELTDVFTDKDDLPI